MTKTGMRLIYIPVFYLDPEPSSPQFPHASPCFPHVEARVALLNWLGCIPFLRFTATQDRPGSTLCCEDSNCVRLFPSIGGVKAQPCCANPTLASPNPELLPQVDAKRVIILITWPPCGSVRLHNPGDGAEMRGQYFVGD